MRRATTGIIAILTALSLAACDQVVRGVIEARKDQPNTETAGPPAPDPNQALIDATPQASLSPEEREELRTNTRGLLDRMQTESELLEGYTPVRGVEDTVVALQPTQTHAWPVRLQRGVVYKIVGACDGDCTDLDIELVDPGGKIIERDTLDDDFPIVNVEPTATGQYTARMMMKSCSIAPCYAAARLYQRTGSPTAREASTRT